MEYKKMMGYSKKNKVVKEKQPKSQPKRPTIVESLKKEINEWSHKPMTTRRWSKKFGGGGLTEFEKQKGKIVERDIEDTKLPSAVERFANKFAEAIQRANLNRMKQIAVISRVISALGIDKNELMKYIQRIKRGM